MCLPTSEEGDLSVQRWDETAMEWVNLGAPAGGSPSGGICGVTDHFSIFAVMVRLEEPQLVLSTVAPDTLVFTDSDYGVKTVTATALEEAEAGEAVLVHEASGGRYLAPWHAELTVTVEEDTGLLVLEPDRAGRGVLTPYAGYERQGAESTWRLGSQLTLRNELEFQVEGRLRHGGEEPEHSLAFTVSGRW